MENLQTTLDTIRTLIRARQPIIYLCTYEERRAKRFLQQIVDEINEAEGANKVLAAWNIANGITLPGQAQPIANSTFPDEAINQFLAGDIQLLDNACLLLYDFHLYLGGQSGPQGSSDLAVAPMIRLVRDCAAKLRTDYADLSQKVYKTLVIVAPRFDVASELEKDVVVVDLPTPDAEEFRAMLQKAIEGKRVRLPNDEAEGARIKERLCQAALGLTQEEFELCLNMSCFRTDSGSERQPDEPYLLSPNDVDAMLLVKSQIIRKSGILEYYHSPEIELGGLKGIRQWIDKRKEGFTQRARDFGLPAPKGVMFIGISGGGKSQLAKLIAKDYDFPLLRLDVGALFQQYVGESEKRMREVIRLAETIAPCVLWIDEIEKGFAGTGAKAADTESPVAGRVFGIFLTWMAERQSAVFVVATANSLEHLPTELQRKGRFDEVFKICMPDASAVSEIFDCYLKPHLDVDRMSDAQGSALTEEGYQDLLSAATKKAVNILTGAEIEQACNEAVWDAFARQDSPQPRITPDDVIKAVDRACQAPLYEPGSKFLVGLSKAAFRDAAVEEEGEAYAAEQNGVE